MTSQIFFENKANGKKYRVLAVDKSTEPPTLTLQGQHAKFTQAFDKPLLQRMGYELVKIEVPETEDACA